jgi:hypothetical protein
MLTRRDVLFELRKMGVKKPSLLKNYLRDFEKYIGNYYGFEVLKTKKRLDHQPRSPDNKGNTYRS